MKRLQYYFKGYLKESILGPFFKLLEAFFELLTPIILAGIIDKIIPHKDTSGLGRMIILLLGLSLLGFSIAITAQYFSSKAAVGITYEMTNDLFETVMQLPKEQRDKLGTGSLVTRLTSDTFQIQTGINQFLRLFLRAPIIVFGSIIMAYHLNKSLTLWFIVMVFVLFTIVYIVTRFLDPVYQKVRLALDKMVTTVQLQLQGVRVIRAFNQVASSEEIFQKRNQNYLNLQLESSYISNLISPLTFFVVNTVLILVIWQGNHYVFKGIISQGLLVALVNYLLQILTELLKLTLLVSSLSQTYISLQRINQIFELKQEDTDETLKRTELLRNALCVNDLSFSYPNANENSLNNINFILKQGQFLGIIGGTGSGKTTLAQLLVKLYPIREHAISLNVDDLSPETINEWRDWVTLVPQKSELFKGSIHYNLTIGLKRDVSDDDLWQALEIAQAKDFVSQLEGQLSEEIEAFGRNLSGGQKQRLTIARALLRKPKLLILDDATSALDYLTEIKLLKALQSHVENKSIILISQRLRSLQHADKILLLDKGRQIACAPHEVLLKENEIYQAIFQSQMIKEDK